MSDERHQARVGIRELRQNLSIYIDRVKDGETFEVTEHGHPVAELGPLSTRLPYAYDQMVADRRITAGSAPGAPGRRLIYIDRSALIKLVADDGQAGALRVYLGDGATLLTTRTAVAEAARSLPVGDVAKEATLNAIATGLSIRELDPGLARVASELRPTAMDTLQALDVAAALELRAELDAFVTYDEHMADAARIHRLPVVSPG